MVCYSFLVIYLLILLVEAAAVVHPVDDIRVFIRRDHLVPDSLVNVYLEYPDDAQGEWRIQYGGSCADEEDSKSGSIIIDELKVNEGQDRPKKLVWHVPASLSTEEPSSFLICQRNKIIGSSSPYSVKARIMKRGFPEWEHMLFDAVKFHSNNNFKSGEVHSKDKKIGIIGAGMSGLFSAFLLDSVGFHNYEIIEASDHVGGRIQTVYYGKPEDYRYQEMGAMRIPFGYSYKNKTVPVKDHIIVFRLAEELNKLNQKEHQVRFINWVQHNENALYYFDRIRLPDGRIPTVGDVNKNSSLKLDPGNFNEEAMSAMDYLSDSWKKKMLDDLYEAHEDAINQGYDDWSEWGYLHNKLGKSTNMTAYVTAGDEHGQIWGAMYDNFVFESSQWKTIDQGMDRLSQAFVPIVGNKIRYHTKVSKLDVADNSQVKVQWKQNAFDTNYSSETYDRVIVSAPFSVVRTWHLPQLSFTIDQAINHLGYEEACKVALEFETRFWEQGDRPIFGGCSSTDLQNGNLCYPSYQLGSKGRGVMLAHYKAGDMARRLSAMPEKEHVALMLENMVTIHGEQVRQQYTGNYHRTCWHMDEYMGAAWAEPLPGQHSLYMPSYFNIEQGLIFVGEHTDIKHAWISAALESALRGVVMLLVEAGCVDEARELVEQWHASWLKI